MSSRSTRAELLQALAASISDNDESFVAAVLKADVDKPADDAFELIKDACLRNLAILQHIAPRRSIGRLRLRHKGGTEKWAEVHRVLHLRALLPALLPEQMARAWGMRARMLGMGAEWGGDSGGPYLR